MYLDVFSRPVIVWSKRFGELRFSLPVDACEEAIYLSLPSVATAPNRCTTFIPPPTRPNIVCLLSRKGVGASVMKN